MGDALLAGALADEARAAIARIAEAIGAPPERTGDAADRLVFASVLADVMPGPASDRMLGDAASRLDAGLTRIGLRAGLAGFGWTVAASFDDDPDAALPQVDAALLAATAGGEATAPLDLIDGLTGVGVYALARGAAPGAAALLARVVGAIVARAERDAAGAFWRRPDGSIDPSVPTGVAGIVALLARVEPAPEVRAVLADAMGWLLARRPMDARIASVIAAAAVALGDDPARAAALALATDATEHAIAMCRVGALGLARGASGLAHAYHRLHRATGNAHFASTARACFIEVLERPPPGDAIESPGLAGARSDAAASRSTMDLWDGAIGVGLALAAAIAEDAPAWDRVILADLPPLGEWRDARPLRAAAPVNVDGLSVAELEATRARWWDASFTRFLLAGFPAAATRIVDVGCGLGHVARAVLPELARARYVGVDLDAERLREGGRALGRAALADRAAFVCGSAAALPLATGSADVVTATLVLQHVPDLPVALAEIARVLRPGGCAVIVEPDHLAVEVSIDGAVAPVTSAIRTLVARAREQHAGDLAIGSRLQALLASAGLAPDAAATWTCVAFAGEVRAVELARHLRGLAFDYARRGGLALDDPAVAGAFAAIDQLVAAQRIATRAPARITFPFHRCRGRVGSDR